MVPVYILYVVRMSGFTKYLHAVYLHTFDIEALFTLVVRPKACVHTHATILIFVVSDSSGEPVPRPQLGVVRETVCVHWHFICGWRDRKQKVFCTTVHTVFVNARAVAVGILTKRTTETKTGNVI